MELMVVSDGEPINAAAAAAVVLLNLSVCLQMHMEEPCFDFLRTKETLG